MAEYQRPRRKLSSSDNTNPLRQVPSGSGSGSQGSTAASSSGGSVRNRSQQQPTGDSTPFSSDIYPSDSAAAAAAAAAADRTNQQQKQTQEQKPYVRQVHGRSYLEAPGSTYPLPIDLPELHRQSLRTMFLTEVFGAPMRSPLTKTPRRILDIGCGTGIWSLLCHRYLRRLGHTGVSFIGVDLAPRESQRMTPDEDMDWTYMQLDVTQTPWPFPDGHFDFVFMKEMTLAVLETQHMPFAEEAQRVLAHGGHCEIWEVDHLIRLLRPHTPNEADRDVMRLGAYRLRVNTPLSAPLNTYLNEYNHWLSLALEKRGVMANPCTSINHILLSETALADVQSCRLVIPFSEIRWEGQGGVAKVITKDGKAYVDTSSRKGSTGGRAEQQEQRPVELTDIGQAVRRTALQTLVQEIQAQELMLREVNGKGQDEWNTWVDRMTHDLLEEGGTGWGECLETGAWWARKK